MSSSSSPWELFARQIDRMFDGVPGHFVEHPWSDLTALLWLYVAVMCIIGIFSNSVRDTVVERIAISIVSLAAFARAFYIFGRGEIEFDAALTAFGCALYVTVITWKHIYVIPRRPDYRQPKDMPKY